MDPTLTRPNAATVLLAIATLLAMVFGGYLAMDPPLPTPGFVAGLLGPEGAGAMHALIGLTTVAAALWLVFSRRVVQLPAPKLATLVFIFAFMLGFSQLTTQYRFISLASLGEWLTYVLAMFVAIAAVGRQGGPRIVTGAVAAGGLVVGLRAVQEYVSASDPTWRVFAGWVHPNAAAGVLLLGFFASLALYLDTRRLPALFPALVAGIGIALTQSKGGLLAEAAALAVLVLTLLGAKKLEGRLPMVLACVATAGIAFGFATLLQTRQSARLAPSQTAGPSRVFSASSTQEQSSGFRKNLWKTSVELLKSNPLGYGLGTFRYHSAEPGITPQTQLAHNSYLQVAVETGIAGAAALLGVLLLWAGEMLRGIRRSTSPNLGLRLGLFAAVAASVAHSLFDSDMYQFGIGFLFFTILGFSLQTAGDGTAPEFLGRQSRLLATGLAVAVGALSLLTLVVETGLSTVAAELAARAANRKPGEVLLAESDHRAAYQAAALATSQEDRIAWLERSAKLGPTPRVYRLLARELQASSKGSAASTSLRKALDLDPNNLTALSQLMDLYVALGLSKEAGETARRLVAVEETPYFKTRAIPEVVPTETYKARLYLSEQTGDPRQIVGLLEPALNGFLSFASQTVPRVKQAEDAGSGLPGVSLDDCRKALGVAVETAKRLEEAYQSLANADGVRRCREAEAAFGSAIP